MVIFKNITSISISIVFCFLFTVSFANQPIPKLSSRVIDNVGLLSQENNVALEDKLKQIEEIKGSQLVILIIETTEPESIEQYSIRVADQWKIGREKIDDGIILLIAIGDRKMRIEVGYGLEGAIPDAYAKRIIETILVPKFRSGQFYSGIDEATDALISLINGETLPPLSVDKTAENSFPLLLKFLFPVLFFLTLFLKYKFKKKGVLASAIISGISLGLLLNMAMGVIAFFVLLFVFLPNHSGRGGYVGRGLGGGFNGGGSFGGGFSGGGGSFGGGGSSGSW